MRAGLGLALGGAGLLAALLLANSCATAPGGGGGGGGHGSVTEPVLTSPKAPGGARAESAEAREIREINHLYGGGAYEGVLQRLANFEKRFPRSGQMAQIHNLHGLAYLATKRALPAAYQFKKAMQARGATPVFREYMLYNLGTAQFEAGQIDEAQKTADEVKIGLIDRDTAVKVRYLRARIDERRGQFADAAREVLQASRMLPDVESIGPADAKSAFSSLLERSLHSVNDLSTMQSIVRDFEDTAFGDQVLFRLASLEMSLGNSGSSETHLRALMSNFPQSPYYSQAAQLLHTGESEEVQSSAVGVLLPLKGKFSRFGMLTLQGIEMALNIFDASAPDSKITLYVEDSGDDADQAVQALNRLVTKDKVVAVLGPLLSKGIEQVTLRAQELGVPLLSLSRATGIQGDYVFQAGLTLRLQAYEMARYAIERMGYKRLAILYPKDKTGDEISQYFWDAVEQYGGRITGVESYAPDETDFRQPVDRMSGLAWPESRQRELDELAKLRDANNIHRRTRHTEQYFALKPIVDYDAVFVPDEPKVAGQILPTFSYRDVDHVHFLGISAWDTPDFPARAQSYAEGAVFVDAFYAASTRPIVRSFIDRYRSLFGLEPTVLEALSYDAAGLLAKVLGPDVGQGTVSRAEIRERLKGVRDYGGVTGRIRYQDGTFMRDLKMLTVHGGKVIEQD